jgi:hypothetical protein
MKRQTPLNELIQIPHKVEFRLTNRNSEERPLHRECWEVQAGQLREYVNLIHFTRAIFYLQLAGVYEPSREIRYFQWVNPLGSILLTTAVGLAAQHM